MKIFRDAWAMKDIRGRFANRPERKERAAAT
jgi:hypothetical protein